MAHYHFDASALVKYYVREPDSTGVRSIIDALDPLTGEPAHSISIADVCIAETTAALAVLHRTGHIRRGAWVGAFDLFMADVTQRFLVIDSRRRDFVTAVVLTRSHPLKAYDAVQLAMALRYRALLNTLQPSLVFVSGDRTLVTAANAEGLVTDNPFDHVSPLDTPLTP